MTSSIEIKIRKVYNTPKHLNQIVDKIISTNNSLMRKYYIYLFNTVIQCVYPDDVCDWSKIKTAANWKIYCCNILTRRRYN
jgi:hypothetical protein